MAFVLYLLYLCGIIKKMFSEVLLLIFTQNLESNNGECFNYGRKRFYRKFHRRGSVETKVWFHRRGGIRLFSPLTCNNLFYEQ